MADLELFIVLVCSIVTLMIVWFNSGAFPAYCKLLGLNKFLLGYDKNTDGLTFPQYLYIKSRSAFECPICAFIIELITCPLCLSFWFSIFGACIFLDCSYIPVLYLAVLAVYNIFTRLLN